MREFSERRGLMGFAKQRAGAKKAGRGRGLGRAVQAEEELRDEVRRLKWGSVKQREDGRKGGAEVGVLSIKG